MAGFHAFSSFKIERHTVPEGYTFGWKSGGVNLPASGQPADLESESDTDTWAAWTGSLQWVSGRHGAGSARTVGEDHNELVHAVGPERLHSWSVPVSAAGEHVRPPCRGCRRPTAADSSRPRSSAAWPRSPAREPVSAAATRREDERRGGPSSTASAPPAGASGRFPTSQSTDAIGAKERCHFEQNSISKFSIPVGSRGESGRAQRLSPLIPPPGALRDCEE